MNESLSFTGGARIGPFQGTWPFGRLSISPGQLTISLAFAGRYTFAPTEVAGLERCGIAANGIRIVHTRSDCPETAIFWCGARAQRVLDAATRAGFHARVPAPPSGRGMPFRGIAIAQGVVAWSALGVLDQALRPWSVPRPPGTMMLAALGMMRRIVRHSDLRGCSDMGAQAWSIGGRGGAVSAGPAAPRRIPLRGVCVPDAVLTRDRPDPLRLVRQSRARCRQDRGR
jgi:hypothetical protein